MGSTQYLFALSPHDPVFHQALITGVADVKVVIVVQLGNGHACRAVKALSLPIIHVYVSVELGIVATALRLASGVRRGMAHSGPTM